MDVAAAEAQLDAFLKDSKLPLNRTARTIASSMQLPPGGLSKVLEFMRDNGRVKGLALASNELGDQDVQVGVWQSRYGCRCKYKYKRIQMQIQAQAPV
jgi:hypothetical protein